MNALVRQMAVLSVLWAVCELLLPEGRQQQMVRITASLLVMTALLNTAASWLNGEDPAQTVMTARVQQAAEDTYQRTALTAMANQIESYCVHMAQRAGYQAEAAVYLTLDGVLDHAVLVLQAVQTPLLSSDELADVIARQLSVAKERIWLSGEGI